MKPGESREVTFQLQPGDLAFYGRDMVPVTEPGEFQLWVGGDSNTDLGARFTLIDTASMDRNSR